MRLLDPHSLAVPAGMSLPQTGAHTVQRTVTGSTPHYDPAVFDSGSRATVSPQHLGDDPQLDTLQPAG